MIRRRHPLHFASVATVAVLAAACPRPSRMPDNATRTPPVAELEARQSTRGDERDFASIGAEARVDTVAPGLVHWRLRFAEGPWAVNVLDVDLGACWAPVALKGKSAGVGRERTTELLEQLVNGRTRQSLSASLRTAAAVNADFFRFSPPGIPLAAHITAGEVIAGPSERPVLATDIDGVPSIRTLGDSGFIVISGDTIPLHAWNRASPAGVALFDETWGSIADSSSGAIEVLVATEAQPSRTLNGIPLEGRRGRYMRGEVAQVDTTSERIAPGNGKVVLVAGAGAPEAVRARFLALRTGADTIHVLAWLLPFRPREAVGGFPILIRAGQIVAGLESAGGRGFGPVRHPRTAVGILPSGKRLLLVTVDGRQPGYSAGMTLPELAALMRDLGATEALNLDGGGSTTMAISEGAGRTRTVNQPSDSTGERPVANALAVAATCDGASLGDGSQRGEQ